MRDTDRAHRDRLDDIAVDGEQLQLASVAPPKADNFIVGDQLDIAGAVADQAVGGQMTGLTDAPQAVDGGSDLLQRRVSSKLNEGPHG